MAISTFSIRVLDAAMQRLANEDGEAVYVGWPNGAIAAAFPPVTTVTVGQMFDDCTAAAAQASPMLAPSPSFAYTKDDERAALEAAVLATDPVAASYASGPTATACDACSGFGGPHECVAADWPTFDQQVDTYWSRLARDDA